jgi:hypothetical protein
VPGDLIDPLFTCWALGWNFHMIGLSEGGFRPHSWWDANIFFPTPAALARSEHFVVQAVMGAPVYAATRSLVLTYNVLYLATFVMSGLFLYLLARDETGDRGAALGAGLLYAFALFRWTQIDHLGGLSSQWMPLALLAASRVARGGRTRSTIGWMAALAAAAALQVTSSGYYLLFFPPFLAAWAVVVAARSGSAGAWLRLAASGAAAVLLSLPLVLPYVALRSSGAARDLGSVLSNSGDLLSWVTAPEFTRLWGPVLDAFPRGEARLFPGVVTPILVLIALFAAARAASAETPHPEAAPGRPRWRRGARISAAILGTAGAWALAASLSGGRELSLGFTRLRAYSPSRALLLLALALALATLGWPRLRPLLRALAARRETAPALFALMAAWLSLGPLVTRNGWPSGFPSAYRWLYEYVPGFDAGRAPARFTMVAACFAALAAAWGLRSLRVTARGRAAAGILCAAFLVETAPVPLPRNRHARPEGYDAAPPWHDGRPSPIVAAIRELPDDAVLALLPFREPYHEARYMYDATYHWRRMVNGYSSWTPREYAESAFAARDPLRLAGGTLEALRAAGATHVVVNEPAWRDIKGARVTQRLVAAGARPLARADGAVLLAVR